MFIKPCNGYVNSLFGKRIHPISGQRGKMHWGADYTSHTDNAIVAAASGTVRVAVSSTTGFGKYVVITHSNGWETLYAHLSVINVRVGQKVGQGQKIGVKGTTGNSTGVHLHFEMSRGRWNNKYTTNINPLLHIVDPDVKHLQAVLNGLGYKLVADGVYGDATVNAVVKYQKTKGLGADGVAGRGTMALIDKESVVNSTPPKKEDTKVENVEYEKDAKPSPSLASEVKRAVDAGITDGTFLKRPATREEVAVMVLRGLNK